MAPSRVGRLGGDTGPVGSPGQSAAGGFLVHRWHDRAVVALALAAVASGFGQFGVVAALGSVARGLGQVSHGATLADQAGLSGTVLGVGLGVIRLASLGSLVVTGLADRFGRRTMLLAAVVIGLVTTSAAALSPTFWWFVVIFAVGRPFLSAANALTQVAAAEETNSTGRARGVAVVTAGYAVGAGAVAILHSLAAGALGFRGVFALALVPLLAAPMLWRWVEEPDRFVAAGSAPRAVPVWGAVGRRYRARVLALVVLAFAVSFVTGPANSFVFLYAQDVLHQQGLVTAAMVVGAGVSGLGGLLVGRWLADRVGRRPTAVAGMVGLCLCGTLAYAGGAVSLVVGYVVGVLAGGIFAPAIGALLNEQVPTEVRASVAGWFGASGVLGAVAGLVVFGAVANGHDRFSTAAVLTFLPVVVFAAIFYLLPETLGKEPEELWGPE
ncbi:MAG: MFS transporter [Actinomycetota bacterium]|nr:MFS transporter [Actinomycetota bacterium]MDA8292965.1 MFS transporter [Actinomycetota bacterium]